MKFEEIVSPLHGPNSKNDITLYVYEKNVSSNRLTINLPRIISTRAGIDYNQHVSIYIDDNNRAIKIIPIKKGSGFKTIPIWRKKNGARYLPAKIKVQISISKRFNNLIPGYYACNKFQIKDGLIFYF